MSKKGRPKKGSEEERVLKERDAEIRRRAKSGTSTYKLAAEFSLSRGRIQQILKGE